MKQVMKFLVFNIVFLLFTKVTFAATENNYLSANLCSISANANEEISYSFEIRNQFLKPQTFHLYLTPQAELACTTFLSDTIVTIEPLGFYKGKVTVLMSDRIPFGGQESCLLTVLNPEHRSTEGLKFISVRSKKHPFLLVTNEILEETKEKVINNAWAKHNLENLITFANTYEVPERKVIDKDRNTRRWKSLSYVAADSEKAFKVILAYKLTGNEAYLNKVVRLVTEVSDPKKGYLSIGAATIGVQVHEGFFFMYFALICDVLYGEEVLSKEQKGNIEKTMRYYLQQDKSHMNPIGIMNHQASANVGSVITTLFLQDMVSLNHFFESDGGFIDQLTKGVMPDGWWFEGTPGYCYLVTERFCLTAQAFENYGWNLFDRRFPARYKSKDFENAKEGFTGMKFDIWGPTGNNTRGIKDMVMAYIPMMDENANLIPNNDGTVAKPHEFYELAYRHFKDDDLAWVISNSERDSWESLLYGIPNLPEVKDPRTESEFVANVGLVALRSQPKSKTPEDQIQAYFKYGTHGGWHGHLDRTGMTALNRYGHKYFGTEMVWFGYGHAGYKECVQTSATHNMVVVDELQQEAVPSEQILFYKGNLMQASVVQTKARWRRIPIFNREVFPPWNDFDYDHNFEPILQRRLSIVTDDYVVIADYMSATQQHTYDWMLHPIGFKSIEGAKTKGDLLPKLSEDSNSPYKYFANAQWYKSNRSKKVMFQEDNMKLDVHTLWPKKANVIISDYPNGGKPRGIRNNPNRKTYGVRIKDKEAQFLNVIEPYKGKSAITKIESNSANELIVFLSDGRKQIIFIDNFKQDDIQITIKDYINDSLIDSEKTVFR